MTSWMDDEIYTEEPAFELVYEFDSALAAKAYKRLTWQRSRRFMIPAMLISLACLVAILAWEANVFLILGTAYTASFVAMWFAQLSQIDEVYESLEGRKIRLLFDVGGISSYSGNTFKRVAWLGVSRVRKIGGYYFIYYERDGIPGGGFPERVIDEDALEFLREHTRVFD